MAEFDPSSASAESVQKKLEKADEAERQRILSAELAGKKRKTVLEPYGIDSDARTDGAGRVLYPWEVEAKDEVRPVQVDETPEERKAREAQREFDAQVEAAAPTGFDEQGGDTAGGVGVAAGGVATAGGTGGGTTTTGTAGGTTL